MTTEIKANGAGMTQSEAIEKALINGDLSGLSQRERLEFYQMRCSAAGLDPRSQPFQYLLLNGRLVLYATKNTSDQLISHRKISMRITKRGFDQLTGMYIVEVQATLPGGQIVEDLAAVPLSKGLSGEQTANMIMKAITKAKRRAVLSACGLGMLDETEIRDLAGAEIVSPMALERPPGEALEHPVNYEPKAQTISEVRAWMQRALEVAQRKLEALLVLEGREADMKSLVSSVNQIGNWLVSRWIESGTLDEASVIGLKGTRDRERVAMAIIAGWQQDNAEFKEDVWSYLMSKARAQLEAMNIEPHEDMTSDIALPESLGTGPGPEPEAE
jgi:hypothetical protein